ncbi:hypothetical protein Tco_1428541 [Tanacetum coccineum]
MLCYLTGMEPYNITCIKDGPFQPTTAEGSNKYYRQWSNDERRAVNQDQYLKSIIISYLPDDIMDFEGPSDTKKNRIMDLKLEYSTFRAKPFKSMTYTRYKTLLNELSNDGTLNLADMYGRFIYEGSLISRRYHESKKALITASSTTPISTTFFSNSIVQDFQENLDDEVDERTSEEYIIDLDIDFHERALLVGRSIPDEEMVQVKVLMALADDELVVRKNHARNGEWIDITMKKINILLSMDEDSGLANLP